MTPRQDPFFAGSLELARGHEGSSSKGKGEPNHAVRSPEAHTPLPVVGWCLHAVPACGVIGFNGQIRKGTPFSFDSAAW